MTMQLTVFLGVQLSRGNIVAVYALLSGVTHSALDGSIKSFQQ